jgi:dipeptidyl aminopeptidase/acylaminoacyl peptidase
MRRNGVLICTIFLLIPTEASSQTTAGYSVEDFLGFTRFGELVLSPSGRHLAFTTLEDDFSADQVESAIWVVDLRAPEPTPERMTWERGSYSAIKWSPEGERLTFVSNRGDLPSAQLFELGLGLGEARPITSPEQIPHGVVTYDWEPDGEAIILATREQVPDSTKRKAEEYFGDVVRFGSEPRVTLSADSPTPTRVLLIPANVVDLRVSPDGEETVVLTRPQGRPEVFFDCGKDIEVLLLQNSDPHETKPVTGNLADEERVRWSLDGEHLFARVLFGHPDSTRFVMTEGNVFSIDLAAGAMTDLAPVYSGTIAEYAPLSDGSVLTLANVSTGYQFGLIGTEAAMERTLASLPGRVSNLTVSNDGASVAFVHSGPRAFDEVYWAPGIEDLDEARPITKFNENLSQQPAPEVEKFTWTNRDGDTIEGVLYWPPGIVREDGLPTVVDIHGGPWGSRTEALMLISAPWAHYPSLLASRGYLVLEPNYRGSTGRGVDFLRGIEGYSCSRPSDDILTGLEALIQRGWANPDRLGVMGYSYGGLLTNCLIGRTDSFKVALSGAGIWNDVSYFGTADNSGQTVIRYGEFPPWEDPDFFWKESAISRAAEISTPTLITIGGEDRRVPTAQGFELYRALEWLGVPTELLVFPGEGHLFAKPRHKLTKVRAELDWLDKHMGEPAAVGH